MKGLYCCIAFFASISIGLGQTTGQFRSFQTGDWNNVNSWERFDGAVWVSPAPSTPTSSAGPITILNGHTISITASVVADQTTIDVGGVLTINSGQELTIAAGAGEDLIVNGQLNVIGILTIFNDPPPPPVSSATVSVNGTLRNEGTINNPSTTRLFLNSGSVYEHAFTTSAGIIPLALWDDNSTCLISGYTSNSSPPANLNQAFGHFTWNTPSQEMFIDLNGALVDVDGNLTFASAPAYVYLTQSTPYTLNVAGNLNVGTEFGFTADANATVNVTGNTLFSGGTTYFTGLGILTITVTGDLIFSGGIHDFGYSAGPTTINLSGNLSFSAGTLTESGDAAQTIRFAGLSVQTVSGNGSLIQNNLNYVVNNLAIVDLGTSSLYGSGGFTLSNGGTIKLGSTAGVAAGDGALSTNAGVGNIAVTGTRTYTAGGNIIYNGAGAQNIGNGFPSTAVNLEINNINGVTNNNNGTTTVIGNLILTSGPLYIGNNNLLDIQSNLTLTGGTIGSDITSSLTFSGTGAITGNLRFEAGANKINNLTISRSGSVTLGSDLGINGALSFTSTGNLDFSGQTLTIEGNNGNITQSGSGGLVSSNTSNLVINGVGALTSLPFSGSGNELNNVTLNRTSAATYTWASAVVVNGTLALNSGTLMHSSGLTMASGSTFARSAGASITTNAPNTSTSYNVSYSGVLTTGLELPSSPTTLNNLTIAGDATLDKPVTINGDLNINSGTFNASTFDLTMAGVNFLANGGSFTINSAGKVTFSRAGTTVLGGSSIGGTQFGNLTVNSGSTLSAPSANINVSGTWENLGSFTPNTGTVTFNGASQNIDPNGQPFYNVSFAGSGIKTLQGALDVNGTLTIASTLDVGANQPINVAGTWTNNGIFTAAGGTVTFDGTSQSINANGQPFFNLTLATGGTKTLANPIDINGALVIASGVTFDVSATAFGVNVAGNWTNDGTFNRRTGTVTFDGTSAIVGSTATNFNHITIAGALTASSGTSSVSGNWLYSSGSFNGNNGTIQFNGATQSITSGGQPFSNVVIGGTNTKTLQDNIDINGNLTLSAATFSVGLDRTINLAGNFDASGGGILAAQAGLFNFDGAAQSITTAGESFYNVAFSGTLTKTLVDALDVNGYVDINSAFAAGANTVTVAGDWDATGGSFSSTGLTIFDGAAQNILSNGSSFGVVNIAGTGTKTLLDGFDADGDLTISSTLDVSTGNYFVGAGGDWNSSAGTFISRAGEVRLNGAAQNVTLGTSDFYTLRVSGTGVKTLLDPLDVNGDLIIANATTGLNVGSDQPIAVAGDWVNDSGLTTAFAAGNGTVTFDGDNTTNVRGTGTTIFNSITVTGNTNVEIETSHSLRATLTLVGVSSRFNAVGSGAAGVFSLISSDDDPTVDGRIASLPVPANFSGDVTVQRYMSQESMPTLSNNRLYRFISSPVANAAVSQIQLEIPVTGTFTGASTCTGCDSSSPSMFGYDETVGSLFDDGWVEFPSAANSETLARGAGYSLYVRGNILPSTLWDVRGPVFSGDIPTLPVSYTPAGVSGADGFNLVGNPYPSAIDWNLIHPASTNIANAVYIRDNANGRYAQYVNGVGTNGGTKDIAMGQGFWVEAIGASPLLPLTENMKSSASPSFFRTMPIDNLLRIEMARDGLSDEMAVRFLDDATDLFDAAFDARKLQNSIFNLSSLLSDNNKLSINTLGSMDCGRDVRLSVTNVSTGHYDLLLSGTESFSSEVSIKLVDSYLNQTVDAKTTSVYGFNVDINNPATFGTERFRLIFEFNGSLVQPEIVIGGVCQGSDASIQISNSFSDVHYAIYSNGVLIEDIGAGNGSNLAATISKDQLTPGENAFELRAVSAYCNQLTINQQFSITNESLPQITTKGGSNCLSGSVNLTATGADEGSYRWYESADSEEPISGATGSVMTTPELNKTKTYYVAAANNLGCEGPRVEVVATINQFEPVTLTQTEGGQLTSSYATGNQWYKDGELIVGATGRTYTPETSGVYSVEITIGQCVTSAQHNFLVTSNEETLSNGKLNIYPNPVKADLVIESKFEQKEPPVIFDQTGRAIGTVQMLPSGNGWVGTFSFSDKTKGLYLLKVIEKGVPRFKRIIKE